MNMKTYKNLWDEFISEENFKIAYKNSIKRKKGQRQIRKFNEDAENNLRKVRELVVSGGFHTSRYEAMKIYEPKERMIYKLPYAPDRIVQHAIMNILRPILASKFIENSYACVEGKGPHRASQKCAEYTRKYQYCLKCDIHHFYPSVDQEILSGMLHRIIRDERFMKIVDDVIFSFPGGKNVPIGNYCSQWFGNYYLTYLDNFVLHELKCGKYVRYCDDFLLFSNNKDYLKECRKRITEYLKEELMLEFSKAEIFNTKQGVDFCGYRDFKDYVLLRKSTAKRIRKRITRIEVLNDRTIGQLASAKGQLRHCCSYNFRKSIGLERRANGSFEWNN